MIRRRLTVKRVDPWSVLKLGLFLNIAGGAIMLLTGVILWSVIRRLQMIERTCEQVQNIFGLQECAIPGTTVLRGGLTMVALWVVVMTAIAVFASFLYNLIADLTGGVEMTALDHTPGAARVGGGVEVAPQLQATSPRMVGAHEGTEAAVPADAVDRRARDPSKLRQAVHAAATKVTEASKQATSALSEAIQPEAESRARESEARTQSMEAVRRQEQAADEAREARRRQQAAAPKPAPAASPSQSERGSGASPAQAPPRPRRSTVMSRDATELTFAPRGGGNGSDSRRDDDRRSDSSAEGGDDRE